MAVIMAVIPLHLQLFQETLAWQPTPEQQMRFQQLYAAVVAGNQQLNLTRLTAPEEFWEKHLWDSLRGLKPWLAAESALHPQDGLGQLGLQVVDIGTGGGFPGIPAAMVLPQAKVMLLDSTRKKVNFLEQLVASLGLAGVQTLTGRAEVVGQQVGQRDRYDLALIRAVGSATVCAEYSLPLLKQGGTAVLYRGQWSAAEEAALVQAAQQLGGQLEQVDAFTTPLTQGTRHCIYLGKVAATPAKFPRPVGIPVQKPLA
ncbi:MAG: 16S rRNA (guanine(527)-N(7))-methyltransferase RsmG [Synechococcales cyanobacterium RU_4_20]|nr:16S rRNA (guanine(527)-N(7))-methyltransferase RsmG [Synechococcales cyanobacterium RU_4_20]NJR68747.1 16S rRNA (guanine(527)-N(7))-methyltransferase RsmG [Synechococcales cyanobacterium CRU_2_2]